MAGKMVEHHIVVTDRVLYEDGAWIGCGVVEGAANKKNVIGLRCFDKGDVERFWIDMSLADALAVQETLAGAIRKYMNVVGLDKGVAGVEKPEADSPTKLKN